MSLKLVLRFHPYSQIWHVVPQKNKKFQQTVNIANCGICYNQKDFLQKHKRSKKKGENLHAPQFFNSTLTRIFGRVLSKKIFLKMVKISISRFIQSKISTNISALLLMQTKRLLSFLNFFSIKLLISDLAKLFWRTTKSFQKNCQNFKFKQTIFL